MPRDAVRRTETVSMEDVYWLVHSVATLARDKYYGPATVMELGSNTTVTSSTTNVATDGGGWLYRGPVHFINTRYFLVTAFLPFQSTDNYGQ
jgi:hypothetical protein